MKLFLRKVVPIFLIVSVILATFTGCPKCPPCWLVPNKTYDEFSGKLAGAVKPAGTANANLYFDNTKSMYGYLADGSGQQSVFDLVCKDLIDVFKGFKKYSINALIPDNSNTLRWTDVGVSGFNYKNKSFYTFKGLFDRPSETGPLQSLFIKANSVVDFKDLNIFITDLAEQEVNNKVLAEKINEVVLSENDHSVALYCVRSYFSGEAHVPQSGVTTEGSTPMFSEYNYTGSRPFYILVVGPTIEVVSICNDFDSAFETTGLKEGTDYNSFRVLSKRGLKYSSIKNADYECFNRFNVPDDDDTYYEEYPSVDFNTSRLNYNLYSVKSDMVFHGRDEMDGLYYIYNTDEGYGSLDKSTFGNARFSFVLPLSDLSDGSKASDVTYDLKKAGEQIDIIVEGGKRVVSGTDEEENEIEEFKWETISYNNLLKGTNPYMKAPVIEYYSPEETVSLVKQYTQDMEDEELPKKELNLYTVDKDGSGVLYVCVEFNDIASLAAEYELLSIRFSITAKRDYKYSEPKWIKDYNIAESATINNTSSKTFFEKTTGLSVFYQYLTGTMSSSADRRAYEDGMNKTVSDIYVVICLQEHESTAKRIK